MLPKLIKRSLIVGITVVAVATTVFFLGAPPLDSDPSLHSLGKARAQLKVISSALEEFHKANGRYPSEAESLNALRHQIDKKGPFVSGELVVQDVWGHPYVYRLRSDGTYVLYSLGPNGRDEGGAGDDISK